MPRGGGGGRVNRVRDVTVGGGCIAGLSLLCF